MTLAKAMTFEETPVKKPNAQTIKRVLYKELDRLSTSGIIWFLAKRHKTGLWASMAIVLAVLYFMPFVPDMILGLFK